MPWIYSIFSSSKSQENLKFKTTFFLSIFHKLVTFTFTKSLFGTITTLHSSVSKYVDFIQICLTFHLSDHIAIKSHILNGLSIYIKTVAKTFSNIFLEAKAIAKPQIHKLAKRGVISTHILARKISHQINHIQIFHININKL